MSNSQWQDELRPLVRTPQIIVGALLIGCVTFAVIAAFISLDAGADEGGPMLTYIAIAFAVTTLLVRAVVPGVIAGQGRKKIASGEWPMDPRMQLPRVRERMERAGDAGKVWMLYLTTTLMAGALIEGGTFCLLMVYLLKHSLPALVVAIGMMVVLALHIPTQSSAFHWIENQLVLIDSERRLEN